MLLSGTVTLTADAHRFSLDLKGVYQQPRSRNAGSCQQKSRRSAQIPVICDSLAI